MHELSLCESMMHVLEEQARSEAFSRVTLVRLEIGALSCIEPEAMRFSFDVVTRGTLAEGARLEIIPTLGKAWCMTCAQAVSVGQRFDACPRCGDELLPPTGGDELRIKELEVD